jgi:hypothetical protein
LWVFPRAAARKALEPYKDVLDLIDKAARRERYFGEGETGEALLQNAYVLDEIANLVAVRARLQIADGDFNGAVHTLQTGLSLAKHLGELPRYYEGQAGSQIAHVMLRQVEDFAQQPKAPNLYWALTDLPRPLIDQRRGVEGERRERYRRYPGIAEAVADVNAGPLTEEQVQACVKEALRYQRLLRYQFPLGSIEFQQRAALTKSLTEHYDGYKKFLLDQGRPKEKVEAMSYVQVALLAEFQQLEQTTDDQMKWYNQPYYKAADALDPMAKAAEEGRGKNILPLYAFGALDALYSRAKLERQIDILRCVEAIRAYAAAHDGQLPATLDDVKELPVPTDVVTGKPFVYKKDGANATLESPEVARHRRAHFDDLAYEITIKR